MRSLRPRILGALMLLGIAVAAYAATRTHTDEIVSSDGGPVTFPGGIVAPTAQQYPASTAVFFSGATYSATVAKVTNLDGITTPATLRYNRTGDMVHVFGRVGVDPSGSGTSTFSLSLPIRPATFTGTDQAVGVVGIPATATSGTCYPVSSALLVRCTYTAAGGTAELLNVNFTYRVQ